MILAIYITLHGAVGHSNQIQHINKITPYRHYSQEATNNLLLERCQETILLGVHEPQASSSSAGLQEPRQQVLRCQSRQLRMNTAANDADKWKRTKNKYGWFYGFACGACASCMVVRGRSCVVTHMYIIRYLSVQYIGCEYIGCEILYIYISYVIMTWYHDI